MDSCVIHSLSDRFYCFTSFFELCIFTGIVLLFIFPVVVVAKWSLGCVFFFFFFLEDIMPADVFYFVSVE